MLRGFNCRHPCSQPRIAHPQFQQHACGKQQVGLVEDGCAKAPPARWQVRIQGKQGVRDQRHQIDGRCCQPCEHVGGLCEPVGAFGGGLRPGALAQSGEQVRQPHLHTFIGFKTKRQRHRKHKGVQVDGRIIGDGVGGWCVGQKPVGRRRQMLVVAPHLEFGEQAQAPERGGVARFPDGRRRRGRLFVRQAGNLRTPPRPGAQGVLGFAQNAARSFAPNQAAQHEHPRRRVFLIQWVVEWSSAQVRPPGHGSCSAVGWVRRKTLPRFAFRANASAPPAARSGVADARFRPPTANQFARVCRHRGRRR